jgi:hypothetical protein
VKDKLNFIFDFEDDLDVIIPVNICGRDLYTPIRL